MRFPGELPLLPEATGLMLAEVSLRKVCFDSNRPLPLRILHTQLPNAEHTNSQLQIVANRPMYLGKKSEACPSVGVITHTAVMSRTHKSTQAISQFTMVPEWIRVVYKITATHKGA